LASRKVGGDPNMTYCETCGVNVIKRRLRECVFSGHVIRWNYWKKEVPTIKTTLREEQKLKEIKELAKKLRELFPDKFNDEALRSKAKEIEEIFYKVMENGRMEKACNTQIIRNGNEDQTIPKHNETP
jgi:predicted transcriptional regulator